MPFTLSTALRNSLLSTINTECANGWIRIFSSAAVVLAELRFDATAFPAPTNGSMTANPITEDSSANNTGTAAIFRIFRSDGTTEIMSGPCATTGTDGLIFPTLSMVSGQIVRITSLTISI